MSVTASSDPATTEALARILTELNEMKLKNAQLETKIDQLHGTASPSPYSHYRKLSSSGLSPLVRPQDGANQGLAIFGSSPPTHSIGSSLMQSIPNEAAIPAPGSTQLPQTNNPTPRDTPELTAQKNGLESSYYSSRVILTTYPNQAGIKPTPLKWYAKDPQERGPIIASRHPNSIRIRNAIGASGGNYAVYRALAVASKKLDPNHRPDFTNTEPPFQIPPNPAWFIPGKIVSLDCFGHLAPQLYQKDFQEGKDIRPTIAMTRAHIKMPELDLAYLQGRLPMDGKVVIPSKRLPGVPEDVDPGIEVNCSKAAIEPSWYLPGIAEKLGISEGLLRRALFEECGGAYPELISRPDIKVFLPPIAGISVYIFGNPALLRDPSAELTFRPHDQCGGSDVFGSDICTCRPYLLFGIEEAIKTAQRGGVGLIVYFAKEGRALGEVTKYLVYNARKRGTDSAANYFKRTSNVAGVEDMRFQAIGSPCVLHWLGVQKIDNMISMSDMKYNSIAVQGGIPIRNRYEIPASMIPTDGNVEIEAKIQAGYFSNRVVTADQLQTVVGRSWEDTPH